MNIRFWLVLIIHFACILVFPSCKQESSADLVIINGHILTVDQNSTICEALAVRDDRIIAVGSNNQINRISGTRTTVIDAAGRTVVPGLIDAHMHPESASVSELVDSLPDIHTIKELLDWISFKTKVTEKGEWIVHPKFFFTRMIDMRSPTLTELDIAAPNHPVFLNGSYGGMINSMAMKVSGITRETKHAGILRNETSGELSGFLRSSAYKLLCLPSKHTLSDVEKGENLRKMFHRYHQYGITSICSGAGNFELFNRYRELNREGELGMRITQNITFPGGLLVRENGIIEFLKDSIMVTGYGDKWVRIGALKIFLDGGILTGTAYMREPWGILASEVFGINDENYRGVINWREEDLFAVAKTANELGWKFTAHCTGGGGVDMLLDVYEQVDRMRSIKARRFSIIHGNFFSARAIERMNELGIYADMQAAWFYKDAEAMEYILGDERILTFHPYRSLLDKDIMVNGGSDHMAGWDADASINPFNPFTAIWTMVSRTTQRGNEIVPSEAITREEALKIYTINNAYASFEEALKGSIETGKLADIVILSDDLMHCSLERIRCIKSELTIVGGNIIYSSGNVTVHDTGL